MPLHGTVNAFFVCHAYRSSVLMSSAAARNAPSMWPTCGSDMAAWTRGCALPGPGPMRSRFGGLNWAMLGFSTSSDTGGVMDGGDGFAVVLRARTAFATLRAIVLALLRVADALRGRRPTACAKCSTMFCLNRRAAPAGSSVLTS